MSEAEIPLDEEDPQEIVHWFDQRPLQLSPMQVSAAVAGAFMLGALATIGALAVAGRLRD